jgi:hypothetical protein
MRSLRRRTPHPSPPVLKLTPPLLPSPVSRGSASPRSSVRCVSPLYSPLAAAEGPEDHRSPPPHRNTAVPNRLRRPFIMPPPRCVSTSPTLPGTSPFSCVTYPHQFSHTWSPGWMPLATPARRRACGHRAVTTGDAHAPRRARAG